MTVDYVNAARSFLDSLVGGSKPLFLADLNSDEQVDLLTTNFNTIRWYKNLGGGIFDEAQILVSDCWLPRSVHASDLDQDGDLDVVATCAEVDKILWFENLGAGEFSSEMILSNQVSWPMQAIAKDINDDDIIDVVACGWSQAEVVSFENNGNADFDEQITIAQISGIYTFTLALEDLNNDGDNDLIVTRGSFTGSIEAFENFGGGNFGEVEMIAQGEYLGGSLSFADLDNDGDLDLVSTNSAADKVMWYENLLYTGFCTDETACNYNPFAIEDDGSCVYMPCFADADNNGDGVLDTDDLMWFLGEYGCIGIDCPGDLNGDGVVNVLDLIMFLELYG